MYKKTVILTLISAAFSLFVAGCTQSGKGSSKGPGSSSAAGSKEAKEKSLNVKVAEVKKRDVSRMIQVVGSLAPFEEVNVSSEVDGKVEKVYVDIGDRVSEGQVLLKISPEEIKYQLDGQLAALRQALARLGLEDENAQLKSDQDVPEVRKAAADRFEAEQNYQRAKELFQQALVPKQQLDGAEARYNSTRATYEATLQQVQITKAAIEQYRAAVQLARKKLRDTEIKAPFAGWIKQRSVAPGQYLKVQAPVFTIVDDNPLKFTAQIPEKMAPWIKVGHELQLRVEAYPDRIFTGKVSRINPSSREDTRSFAIEALIDNRGGMLKPGFFASASIATSKKDSIITVPTDAVTYGYGVYRLFVIKDNKVSSREIKLGDKIGEEVEVIEGVKEKEFIALSNLARLNDGMEVHTVSER